MNSQPQQYRIRQRHRFQEQNYMIDPTMVIAPSGPHDALPKIFEEDDNELDERPSHLRLSPLTFNGQRRIGQSLSSGNFFDESYMNTPEWILVSTPVKRRKPMKL